MEEDTLTRLLEEYVNSGSYLPNATLPDVKDPEGTWIENPYLSLVRSWFRAKLKYEQLVRDQDPAVKDIKPGAWVLCDVEGVLRTGPTKRSVLLNSPKNSFLFRHGLSAASEVKVVTSTSIPDSVRQWVTASVQKRQTDDAAHDIELLVGKDNFAFTF